MRILRGMFLLLGVCIALCLHQSQSTAQQEQPMPGAGQKYISRANAAFLDAAYDTAIHYYQKAAIAFEANRQYEAYAHALIRTSETARVKENINLAQQFLTQAKAIIGAHKLRKPLLLGDLYHLESNILSDLGDYKGAIRIMKAAIRQKSMATPRPDSSICMSLNNVGFNYYYLNEFDSAKYYYEVALRKALPFRDRLELDISMYLQNIGNIHTILGNTDSVLFFIEQSAEIRERRLKPKDPDLAYLYSHISEAFALFGNNEKALEYNKKAEAIFLEVFGENAFMLGTIYSSLGLQYRALGDINKALDYFRKAIYVYSVSSNPNHTGTYAVYNSIGIIHIQLEEYELALEYLKRSLSPNIKPDLESIVHRNMAMCYQVLGNEAQAIIHIKKSLEVAIHKLGETHFEAGRTYRQYGKIMQSQGKLAQARAFFDQAIEVYQLSFGKNHPLIAETYIYKAEVYHLEHDYDAALKHYQKALMTLDNSFTDTSVFNNPNPESNFVKIKMIPALTGKAGVFRELFKQGGDIHYLQASLVILEDVIGMVDIIRNQLTDHSKMFYTEQVRDFYLEGVSAAYQLFQLTNDPSYLETAFMMTEKSKYAVLLSTMRDMSAREIGGIPDSLRLKEQSIKDQMAGYQKLIYDEQLKGEPDQNRLSRWDSQLFSYKRQHEELIHLFENQYPRYHNLKYKTDVIPTTEIQKALRADEALVEYLVGDTTLFTFYITRDDFQVEMSTFDSSIIEQINTLRLAMTPLGISNSSPENFALQVKAAHELFKVLLEPGYDLLKGKDILIIPDDILGYLSFDILLTKATDVKYFDYSRLPYLILDHNIAYAYLATLQYKETSNPIRKDPTVIGFAPNYTGIQHKPKENLISLRGMEKYLLPIKHAKMEMSLLEKSAEAKVYIDNEANEQYFKQYSPDYDIIHLAMHTVIDDENPMFSKLVFTIVPSIAEDGLLNTFEIYNMNLKARMVVLSACNTGYGQLHKGEGIISLARAFMYAGVPGIIMTLWAIEDKSGYDIMTYFYQYLSKGLGRDVSLRKAKIDYLKQAGKLQSHPYFWAAYVTVGDQSPVYPKNRHTTLLVVVCLLALLLIAGGILRGRRRGREYYFFRLDRIKSIFGL